MMNCTNPLSRWIQTALISVAFATPAPVGQSRTSAASSSQIVRTGETSENLSATPCRIVGVHAYIARGNDVDCWNLSSGDFLKRFSGLTEQVRAIAVTSDHRRVAAAGGRESDLGSFSLDNSIRIWDTESGSTIRVLPGERVDRAFDDRPVQEYVGHIDLIHTLLFDPDNTQLLSAAKDGSARLWDVETGASLQVFDGVSSRLGVVSFNSDGSQIMGLSLDSISIWRTETGELTRRIVRADSEATFECATFSPSGSRVLFIASNGVLEIQDVLTETSVLRLKDAPGRLTQAAFTRDGIGLYTASTDGNIRLICVKTGVESKTLSHPGPVRRFEINSDATRCLSVWSDPSMPNSIKTIGCTLWNLNTGQAVVEITEPREVRRIVGFTPDGESILCLDEAHRPGTLRSSRTGEVTRLYEHH
ncbi:MAG: hypothetical protein KJZ69_18880 [Phycisphaerales bacterium]|nr:hypothetical protein [Phycisphaerales bacterium]